MSLTPWGIDATTYEFGYILPYRDDWIFEASFRFYDQSKADFYSDLFPFQDAQNFLARDKELSNFSSTTLGAGVSWEFGRAWKSVQRGSLSLNVDWIQFDYDNFRDLTDSASVGNESLYAFDATVIRPSPSTTLYPRLTALLMPTTSCAPASMTITPFLH